MSQNTFIQYSTAVVKEHLNATSPEPWLWSFRNSPCTLHININNIIFYNEIKTA